jgi:hypothetical protein
MEIFSFLLSVLKKKKLEEVKFIFLKETFSEYSHFPFPYNDVITFLNIQ